MASPTASLQLLENIVVRRPLDCAQGARAALGAGGVGGAARGGNSVL
jgi:hypothetical protein